MNSLPLIRKNVLAATALLCLSQVCAAEQTYLIRFKFQPDEQLRYQSLHCVTQTAAAAAGQKVDTTKVEQTRVFRITKVTEDGAANVSMQFEHVRMELKSGQGELEVFDSKMPDQLVPQKFRHTADKLKGSAPKYTLQADGTPVSELGLELVPDGGQASFMMPLPKQQLAVGETWKVNMMVKPRIAEGVIREILLLRTYRLESVDDGIATITFATSLSSPVKSPAVKAQLLQATPLGTITFDLNKGVVLKRVLKFDKSVLGALGPNTMLSAVGNIEEHLLTDTEPSVTVR